VTQSRRKAALALVRLHHVQERIEAANEAVQEGARDVAEQERAMEGHDERMAALKREEARLVRLVRCCGYLPAVLYVAMGC
jgi:hypothetical protein